MCGMAAVRSAKRKPASSPHKGGSSEGLLALLSLLSVLLTLRAAQRPLARCRR